MILIPDTSKVVEMQKRMLEFNQFANTNNQTYQCDANKLIEKADHFLEYKPLFLTFKKVLDRIKATNEQANQSISNGLKILQGMPLTNELLIVPSSVRELLRGSIEINAAILHEAIEQVPESSAQHPKLENLLNSLNVNVRELYEEASIFTLAISLGHYANLKESIQSYLYPIFFSGYHSHTFSDKFVGIVEQLREFAEGKERISYILKHGGIEGLKKRK